MGNDIVINIAEDFSEYPIGRDATDSVESNGEKFRIEYLNPALVSARENGQQVFVSFEGVESFGSSFLEEAFGGLVRKNHWTASDLEKLLKIVYIWPGYARFERSAWRHINKAQRTSKN